MSHFIAGMYVDMEGARAALTRLLAAHFDSEAICVFVPGPTGGRAVPVRRKSADLRYAMFGTGIGAVIGVVAILAVRFAVIPDPGILAPNLALTLLRGIFVPASIGALAGYVAGLGVWNTSIEFGDANPPTPILVGVSVTSQRLQSVRTLLQTTQPHELVECESEARAQSIPTLTTQGD